MHDQILRDAVMLVLFADDTRWTFLNADSR
jgi:hypothetical protein